ncbi:TetR/AcrR family transcriptional regulator [Algoriphagus sp. AGSA1]|uniref:TetR/AcrR family transcriptional regulator n=1 Tax=Algoriphagus sp. AGSA1 TaxID=2907213 RepID=UPI001F3CCE03|nr:TetR/AcrR family transcriptional regulator [Algoriphagus sp. AGSA1]MCE7057211.1 TetR/AcrR family transcriptional regulator [Algoriphagus sp. AGSA1]
MKNKNEAVNVRENILTVGRDIISQKGFSAVGLNEILKAANVPKGSFYHYFESKDFFGKEVLDDYFEEYLAEMDMIFNQNELSIVDRLMKFFERWQERQAFLECQGKCLVVKVAADVSDLSEAMRQSLQIGTSEIIKRLSAAIEAASEDGSLKISSDSTTTAESAFHLWLGASVMVKIIKNTKPFELAMNTTRQLFGLQPN